ncbi:glutathione S-transferase (plasmid) [Legionella adelaidensis]|uniref:Glutathione S-transferase n=1 Tax=Legionella adelaidensis TaxID=45056 RepID=A0A0W0R5L9_9GAMM|nr:glutathione transferase GstA [Legionella adelaidensis]KTC66330.1 glutathione S-transferase [Legionella adelaidensis]VEH84928.1 glutathione S-transferase [Legionella adelaidensis]
MKLYYANSVCSLAVRIILHELSISCEYEAVNLKTKQTETGTDYLKVNPKGSVPALVLNNSEVLTENAVILQYLADINYAVELLPPVGEISRYRTLEWLNFVSTDLHRYCAPLFWSKFSDETKNTVFTPILKKKLLVVDTHLQDNKFLMGNRFTLGDGYLFVILIWLAKLKVDMNEWPNLSRYFSDMKQCKSVQKALEEEGLTNL